MIVWDWTVAQLACEYLSFSFGLHLCVEFWLKCKSLQLYSNQLCNKLLAQWERFSLVYHISMIQFVLFPKKHWVLMAMQHDILQFLRTAVVPLNSLHQWLRLLFLYISFNSHSLSHSWHTCTQAHLHSDVFSLRLTQWLPACWNLFSPSTSVQITSPCGFNPLFFFCLTGNRKCVRADRHCVSNLQLLINYTVNEVDVIKQMWTLFYQYVSFLIQLTWLSSC